jgi:hypothetical protein
VPSLPVCSYLRDVLFLLYLYHTHSFSFYVFSLLLYYPYTFVYLRAARLVIAQLPAVKELSLEIIETIFLPKAVTKQLVLLVALEAGLVTIQQVTAVIQSITGNFSSRSRLIKQLQTQQQNAVTQDDWVCHGDAMGNLQYNILTHSLTHLLTIFFCFADGHGGTD